MTARLLDGKALAATITSRLREEAAALPAPPSLACLWAGEDPGAASYRRGLANACQKAGVSFIPKDLEAGVSEEDLLGVLRALNADPGVSGVILQTPLPPQVSSDRVVAALDPRKDVEGVSPTSLGMVIKGSADHAPCTARAALALARASGVSLQGAEAVVIGASVTVGKPAALLLLEARATVTVCRRATRDLAAHTRRADILVVAVGSPGLVTGDMIKPGAIVIDVGINRVATADGKTRLVGDVAFAEAKEVAGAITPVPGGVGPMTIACLLRNTLEAYRLRQV